MKQEQEPGKRIVSRKTYIRALGKLVVMRLEIGMLLLLTTLLIWATLISMMVGLTYGLTLGARDGTIHLPILALLLIPVMATTAYRLSKCIKTILLKYHEIDNVVPLTRANTADLPAPDSLVRASQEPAQAQEDVLLRAASQTQENHEEQLLRAGNSE